MRPHKQLLAEEDIPAEELLDVPRMALVQAYLTPLACAEGAADRDDFMQMLRSNIAAPLHRDANERETSFCRDFTPFELLRRAVLPKLIKLKRQERKLTIWSAASSSEQETYSLAMMLCEDFPELSEWDVRIFATEISEPSREHAMKGRYRRLEVNRGLPAGILLKYFERDGDEWEISKEMRSMVNFQWADLSEPRSSLPKFDLVLLRNVLLDFPQANRKPTLTDVHRMIYSHGVLLMGSGELAEDSTDLFRVELDTGCYYYRKN